MSGSAAILLGGNNSTVDPYLPVVWAAFTTPDIQGPDWIDNSGTTGNRMVTDSTGTLTWAPHNLLLNSATLATQTVPVTVGATNILSFYGTGSVALSGAATGTLAGTGANNRVSLIVTPTTTSLTLTVSGSVTQAQLERVTYQTQPRAYTPTTSAAVFLPRYDYDASTTPATPRGMLIEEARSNLLLRSQDFSATWTSGGLLAFGSGSTVDAIIAPDGTTTADLITEDTSGNAHRVFQTFTMAAATAYTFTFYVRRAAGSRNVVAVVGGAADYVWASINLGNGAVVNPAANVGTATGASVSVDVVGNYYRVKLTIASAPAGTGYAQIWIDNRTTASGGPATTYTGDGTSGLHIWGAQLEAGAFATSYIPTTTGAASRVADVVKLTGAALTTLQAPSSSVVLESNLLAATNGRLMLGYSTTSGVFAITNNTILNNYDALSVPTAITATAGSGGLTSVNRVGAGFDATTRTLVFNSGTVGTTNARGTTITAANLGALTNGNSIANGWYRSLAFYNSRLPDATLKAKSTVGAAY